MAAPVETGLTYDDLERFETDDRYRYELIDGALYVTPKGLPRHQEVILRVGRRLLDHADAHAGKAYVEPGVYYDARNYVIPDTVLLSAASLERMSRDRIDVPPDLAVEVSSPSTRRHDLVRKRALYEREGVAEYWFVDLDADRVEIYRNAGERFGPPAIAERGDTISPPRVPGLTVEVDDLLGPPEEE
jgi:Uma2 family endonuclease